METRITTKAFELQRKREAMGIAMENRCIRALIAMQVAQREYVKIHVRPGSETSAKTFSNEELARALKTYDHDIAKVATFFNVSKGCIYNRIRGLPNVEVVQALKQPWVQEGNGEFREAVE